MRIPRPVRTTFAFLAVAATLVGGDLRPAAAQEPAVQLRLDAQTPWTTNERPVLRVQVTAQNLGIVPLEELSVGLALSAAVRARNEYETIVSEGLPFTVFAPAPTPVGNALEPGGERPLRLVVDLTGAVSGSDSLVYPAAITLFSAGRPAATLTTAVVHLVREPEVPVPFTWWTTLGSGPVLDPEGRLAVPAFETSIGPGGSSAEAVRAISTQLLRPSPDPMAVVVEPLLLEGLMLLSDGYTRIDGTPVERGTGGAKDAADLLHLLRDAAAEPAFHLVGLPFAAPQLPAMLRSGLEDDLVRQYRAGEERLRTALGRGGDVIVAAAPDKALDEAALSFLAERGASVLLGAADSIARPEQPNAFAPPAIASVRLPTGGAMDLILPDPGTQALLEGPDLRADPVRLAQVVLGELAVIWREEPVPIPPRVRGLAVEIPPDLPAGTWSPLVQRLSRAPFLQALSADDLLSAVSPQDPPTGLPVRSPTSFSIGYRQALQAAQVDLDAYSSMLEDGSGATDGLARNLWIAEGGDFLGREDVGAAWIAHVSRSTEAQFMQVAPLPSQAFTLTSTSDTIPIRLGAPNPGARRVVVELQSSWFVFPEGPRKEVTLAGGAQFVSFKVEATGTGRRTIRVLVRAPSGPVIAQGDLVVRSTAANRIALLVTAAAGLGLIALWSRRWFRRTKS